MKSQPVKALSISRPIFDLVKRGGVTSRVIANYHRVCNLMTCAGNIIALVDPAIGNGPFGIVLQDTTVLQPLKPGLPAVFSPGQLLLGHHLVVSLDGACLWRPEVNWECLTTQRRKLEDNLAALCGWLSQGDYVKGLLGPVLDGERENGTRAGGIRAPHRLAFLAQARAGIKGLLCALRDGDRSRIHDSATLLAGLGPGLTPAGDDYLVGFMAGLRVWPGPLENHGLSPAEVCHIILEAAEGRTTRLSTAFLRSAAQGMFGEDWHELLAELAGGEAPGIQRAARRILSSGATSGADALAGFLSLYLHP